MFVTDVKFANKSNLPLQVYETGKVLLDNQPDVMNINQMSSVLGVSTKTGYALLQSGKIAFLKIGRTYRIPKIKLIEFLVNATNHYNHNI